MLPGLTRAYIVTPIGYAHKMKATMIVHPEESFYLRTPLAIMSMECRQLRLTREQDADDNDITPWGDFI